MIGGFRSMDFGLCFWTEVVRHLEKIRRKSSNNFRVVLRRRSRNPNVLVRSSTGKGFSNGCGSGYAQTGVCVLRGLGRGCLRKNGGDNEEDEWELDAVWLWSGGGYFFVIFLLARLVSSFHCWYSCQRLMSAVETSLGTSSSSSVRSTKLSISS